MPAIMLGTVGCQAHLTELLAKYASQAPPRTFFSILASHLCFCNYSIYLFSIVCFFVPSLFAALMIFFAKAVSLFRGLQMNGPEVA